MNKLEQTVNQLKTNPTATEFQHVIDVINQYYEYSATAFTNGPKEDMVRSDVGENEGSCKIFSFAKIHQLSKEQTLHCFGTYYREDVLQNPEENNHSNIRNFMIYGWDKIVFNKQALALKTFEQ